MEEGGGRRISADAYRQKMNGWMTRRGMKQKNVRGHLGLLLYVGDEAR